MSLLLFVGSIVLWFNSGSEKYGIDFVGGSEIVLKFPQDVKTAQIRKALEKGGFSGAVVQAFGDTISQAQDITEYSIRVKSSQEQGLGKQLRDLLKSEVSSDIILEKEDYVGPIIGNQIRKDGLWALCFSLVGILIYISLRFELRFACGAVLALIHDVVITTGVFIVSGGELSTSVLAALLTIVGYSLNDTIVVFDRIRENLLEWEHKKRKGQVRDLVGILNSSVVQTLSRTVLTSLTTLFVVLALWLFGGGAVADLAFTLVIGVIVGTYSSIFIASPSLLLWVKKK